MKHSSCRHSSNPRSLASICRHRFLKDPHYPCALAFGVLLFSSAHAQSGKGTLTGTITDPQGAALQGVRVTIHPGTYTALTNATGQYTILGINAGKYTVDVAYVGFPNVSKPVVIAAGQTISSDLSLAIANSVQNVQVYAPRQGGELEAINRTFNADNIISQILLFEPDMDSPFNKPKNYLPQIVQIASQPIH